MSLAPFAAIEQRIADVTSAMLANVVVTTADGATFGAEIKQPDQVMFDVLSAGNEELVYLSSHGLSDGDSISINGAAYIVAGAPRRLNSHFSACSVARV